MKIFLQILRTAYQFITNFTEGYIEKMLFMEWVQIKRSIIEGISSRGLKDPNIRLRALDRIEKMLQNNFPQLLQTPAEFEKIDKNVLKKKLTEIKGQNLSGAESSIINEIYNSLL